MFQVKTKNPIKTSANLSQEIISWKSYYNVMFTKKTPHKPLKPQNYFSNTQKKGQIFVLPKNISLSKFTVSLEKQSQGTKNMLILLNKVNFGYWR